MNGDTIRFRDIAKGVLKSLPEAFEFNRGLFNLATYAVRPDRAESIGLLIEDRAHRYPQQTALLFEDRRWTYAQFNGWANRIARVLKSRGVKAGDAVAILMENRPEVLACVAAVLKLGAIAGMLNHQQRGDVLRHSIDLTRAKVIISGEECRAALESSGYSPACDAARQYLWEGETTPEGYADLRNLLIAQADDNLPETAAVTLAQPAFYIFTSGTTGLPKASVMTHRRWLRSMAGLGQMVMRLRKDDILYCALPLYHNNALTVSWGAALGGASALALGRKFSASRFWDEIRRYHATAFCYIGELCRYLLNQPPSVHDRNHEVRIIVGKGLRPEIWEEFQQRFGIERISEFYGASEGNLAFVNGFGLSKTAGYCPMSFSIVEFDTKQEQPRRMADGYMRKVAKGGAGLLITEVNEKYPFDGYTDQKATESKLLRDVFIKGDCWFNTGDLVRDQGYRHIQFVDRVGDTFRWKGENVATTEVEGALNRYVGVQEAVVYGVQVPGADGRAGMAALTWTGELPGRELARHLRAELPAYAVPLFLRLRAQQEVTGTFKFRKVELKQQGFDPASIDEPLYVLLDEQGYVPMSQALHDQILRGQLRL